MKRDFLCPILSVISVNDKELKISCYFKEGINTRHTNMLHTIENELLTCMIESNGAEIRSLKNKVTGEEYIWQIDESVWGSSSPVLFPAIGKIKESKVILEGKEYQMPKHGIVRNNDDLEFRQLSTSACCFTLNSSSKTKIQYPFDFSFSIEFSLKANRLMMNYIVENKDSVPMNFACGGHTAYACPLDAKTELSDYVVEFPNQEKLESHTLGDSGLLSNQKRNIEINNSTLTLSDTLFNQDALIFSNINHDSVRLRKKGEEKGIVVHFQGYPNLALWSKPKADYVCIEPWLGLPDNEIESLDLTEKTSYMTIDPGSMFQISIETEIE